MQVAKPVGRNASALKYDILSALSVQALASDKHRQRLTLRLLSLITTRYNWRNNELSIGREEIARLWSVEERTVKREMAKLRTLGWVTVKRPGARGRVTVYELDLTCLMRDTQPVWPVIGADFVERMQHDPPSEPDSNIVPFKTPPLPAAPEGDDVWSRVQHNLRERDPELWSSWFRHLSEAEREGGRVTLVAPSRFMADYVAGKLAERLRAAYAQIEPDVRSVRIESAG